MDTALNSIEHSLPEVVPSLMIPLAGRTLLAPTVSVAEIVPYAPPLPIEHAPAWLLGTFIWRDQQVPLLSFEGLCGDSQPDPHSRSRVVVFNNTGVSEELPFIAIATQGIPKLARVGAEDISAQDAIAPGAYERLWVLLNGEGLLIPDITALEQIYLDWRTGQSSPP